jgi:hypothetical protein
VGEGQPVHPARGGQGVAVGDRVEVAGYLSPGNLGMCSGMPPAVLRATGRCRRRGL